MERVYLTDITLHVRGHRQTGNFSKVAGKGRMYSPLPKAWRSITTRLRKRASSSYQAWMRRQDAAMPVWGSVRDVEDGI